MAKKEQAARNIGLDVKPPKESCNDPHCAFHGSVAVRGRVFVGNVIKQDINKTVTVEWPRQNYLYKYERFEKRRSRVKVHNPPCLNVKVGDKVKIIETRPISKTKNFVVIEKVE
ncbi:30S ribosomal protein S17 [Candidatus Woesearchaeota archaeon]|nr:MAG: 30S ribosomal protein S17 [Candidatus Woesearchaeota archaeon]